MKSKKFVLAGLVLLAAITMVLLPLAGCKNDSVPPEVEKQEQTNDTNDTTNTEDNTSGGSDSGTGGGDTGDSTSGGNGGGSETDKNNTAAKLVSISVTSPTTTVYSVGQSFDPTGMVVTATYDDEESKDVTSLAKTDFDFSSAGVKTVIVRYSEGGIEVRGQFEIRVLPKKLTNYESPNNTGSEWTYVEFGEWPQTIKAEGVDVDVTKSKQMGMFTYYLGSDGNHYVKAEENAYEAGYKYSDNSEVKQKDESSSPSTRWFKVEPIVWRVLNKDYARTGKALLLAEKILTGDIPYYDVSDTNRTVGVATIHPNNYEHSAVRAWLNGLEYEYKKDANTTQTTEKKYLAAGFLQTAFTADAQSLIELTSVGNSVASTFGTGVQPQINAYASDTPPTDKIFLLSGQEATTSMYGFAAEDIEDSTRIRVTTDYAKATGANQNPTPDYGGWWWLRSPIYDIGYLACVIYDYGGAYYNSGHVVDFAYGGVVPALSISLQ